MSDNTPETNGRGASSGPNLITPLRFGPYELENRFVMAPLTRNRAGPGNVPRDMNAEYYAQRASAGLIMIVSRRVV